MSGNQTAIIKALGLESAQCDPGVLEAAAESCHPSSCSCLICVGVIEHPDIKHLWGERVYLGSQFWVTVHHRGAATVAEATVGHITPTGKSREK